MLQNLEQEVQQFFTAAELDQLARSTKFSQRSGKITGSMFFDLLVFSTTQLRDQSLDDLGDDLDEKYDLAVSKQALHKRFNAFAVAFLKQVLSQLLTRQVQLETLAQSWAGSPFKRILIKDSVCFQLNETVADVYPGSGGSGSPAAVRIQFEYDVLKGQINDLSLNPFNQQDASNSLATLELTQGGDLIIRDLAYMHLKVLKKWFPQGVFFLCRLQSNVKVYERTGKHDHELNWVKLRDYMQRHQLTCLEKKVRLGERERLPVRLIVHLLPATVVAERLRKANRNAKKKNRGPVTQEYKARAAFNLFITNARAEHLPTDTVWLLYRLRWQIELTFKIWKSLCHLDKLKKVQRFRLECYIYAKLILIVLGWQIIWSLARLLFAYENQRLSLFKAFKIFCRKKIDKLRPIFLMKTAGLALWLQKFYRTCSKKCILATKKHKISSTQILETYLNSICRP